MNLFRIVIALAITVTLSGCAVQKKVSTSAVFDPDQAKLALEPGNNTITGSAVIRQVGGGSVNCAASEVNLLPYTEYTKERMELRYGSADGGYQPAKSNTQIVINEGYVPDEYPKLVKTTQCDAQGFFKFDKLRDGTYFVISQILWKPNQYVVDGGILMKKVEVSGGETKSIVLSPR